MDIPLINWHCLNIRAVLFSDDGTVENCFDTRELSETHAQTLPYTDYILSILVASMIVSPHKHNSPYCYYLMLSQFTLSRNIYVLEKFLVHWTSEFVWCVRHIYQIHVLLDLRYWCKLYIQADYYRRT